MTTEIPLSQDLVALVDDEDATAVLAHKWHAHRCRETFYAERTIRSGSKWTTLGLHTSLTGWPLTDHINGNGLDNRRANLRPATNTQNAHNARRRKDNTSGFKGVSFCKRSGKWRAVISVGGRQVHVGRHVTAEEAARAYDAAARELHGEFASLNFPSSPRERGAA